ncbi:MAG: hypothetical protein CTY33_09460 [Methylotenera sp.]|nr:MAG: hypothetical protein CTY33_09460 [Methylotenera sp.]
MAEVILRKIPTKHWFETDEIEEAVSALEVLAKWTEILVFDISYWKWVILVTHNAMQGFMVIALRGSDRLRPLRDDVAKKWLEAHQNGTDYPVEKLDNFSNLYKKIKSDLMLFFVHSKKFVSSSSQDTSVRRLNSFRDDFIHFLPQSWSIEVSGMPKICADCLNIIHFLGWESGNVTWYEQGKRIRAEKAIATIRENLATIENIYSH